jgi:hypothetical protein
MGRRRPRRCGPLARDAVLRLDFVFGIGIPFSCATTTAATTEAPPRRRSRRGRIPKRSQHSELDTVPLSLREQASPFWIILLLVSGDPAYSRIKLAAPSLPNKALTNVRFRGCGGLALFSLGLLPLDKFGPHPSGNVGRLNPAED